MTDQQRQQRATFIREQSVLWLFLLYAGAFVPYPAALDALPPAGAPAPSHMQRYLLPLVIALPSWLGLQGWARRRTRMKHYAAPVQCQGCGHRFSVCVHSWRSGAPTERFIVVCPENGSKVHVPADAFVAVQSCPAGAVAVRDNRP
jgi:hypothetical protein